MTQDAITTENVQMAIGSDGGQVKVHFDRAVASLTMDPQNAIDIAMSLTDHAFEARDGVKPAGDTLKSELIERHRTTLTQRLALMMPQIRKMSDGKAALTVVETMLKEVF